MHPDLHESRQTGARVQVVLDGKTVALPRQSFSLAGIRSFLETLALEQQRILCAFRVDGKCLDLDETPSNQEPFTRVEGESIDLADMPLRLIRMAMLQTAEVRERVSAGITLILINEGRRAREYWWDLVRILKQPLLTVGLLPETAYYSPHGSASLTQLRKWQLQQLASIIKEVDETCWSEDSTALSNALESRVLPWLNALESSLELWHETLSISPLRTCSR
jgi:hypothetical protein